MALTIDLIGKKLLVCGVHKGGIGGATCRQIAKAGGTVIALDKEQSYVDDIAREVRELGGTIHTLVADLMDVAQCEKVIPTVLEKYGPIDGVANVAGGTRAEEWMPLDETPGDSFWSDASAQLWLYLLCLPRCRQRLDREGPEGRDRKRRVCQRQGLCTLAWALWRGQVGAHRADPYHGQRVARVRHSGEFGIARRSHERAPSRKGGGDVRSRQGKPGSDRQGHPVRARRNSERHYIPALRSGVRNLWPEFDGRSFTQYQILRRSAPTSGTTETSQ